MGRRCKTRKDGPSTTIASCQYRAIIGALDTLVDIGAPAEKEVIR